MVWYSMVWRGIGMLGMTWYGMLCRLVLTMIGAQRAALVLGHTRVAPLMAAGVGDFSFHSLVERHFAHGADVVGKVRTDPAQRGHV